MCLWFIVRARISRPPACEGHFISAGRFDQRRHLGALALRNHTVADYLRARRLHLLHQGSGRAIWSKPVVSRCILRVLGCPFAKPSCAPLTSFVKNAIREGSPAK